MRSFDYQRDAAAFRIILKKIMADCSFNYPSFMREVKKLAHDLRREPRDVEITRNSFIKFLAEDKGLNGTNREKLEPLWTVLSQSEKYSEYFIENEDKASKIDNIAILSKYLHEFITENEVKDWPSVSAFKFTYQLNGRYIMYRKSNFSQNDAIEIYRSLFQISYRDGGAFADEFVDERDTSGAITAYPNVGNGLIFSFGTYFYYLLRKAHMNGVIFGCLYTYTPFNPHMQIDTMMGIRFETTHDNIVPGEKFWG